MGAPVSVMVVMTSQIKRYKCIIFYTFHICRAESWVMLLCKHGELGLDAHHPHKNRARWCTSVTQRCWMEAGYRSAGQPGQLEGSALSKRLCLEKAKWRITEEDIIAGLWLLYPCMGKHTSSRMCEHPHGSCAHTHTHHVPFALCHIK